MSWFLKMTIQATHTAERQYVPNIICCLSPQICNLKFIYVNRIQYLS